MRSSTIAVHAGSHAKPNGPLVDPIVTSSTYVWEDFDTPPDHEYARYGNLNRDALESTVAALEGAKHAVSFASGMAAVTAVLELPSHGDQVLIARDIYGGTLNFGRQFLPKHGIEVGSFDPSDLTTLEQALKPNSKLIMVESPTNPLVRVVDLQAIAEVARRRNVMTVVDNTFATPLLQNPLSLGADIVVHSSTKYLGGHSDVIGGVAVTNSEAVHGHLLAYAKSAGGIPGPFDCWLTLRGIKTLGVRMRAIQESAQAVAEFLSTHRKVDAVHYPGLQSNEGHELAKCQMRGFGGMLAIELAGGVEAVRKVCARLKVTTLAASLGGVESLVSYPPVLSHKAMSEAERLERGIKPNLLRLSIGLEDPQDLLEDWDQALS